jgi:tRNA nucleotidyltransferase/poly(A) polymerase
VSPEIVFSSDGVRILRMIRLASELGFAIEQKTFAAAYLYKNKLDDISGMRKRNDLMLVLGCQERYPNFTSKKAFLKGLLRFNSLKLWRQFFLPIDKVRFSLVKKVDVCDRFLALIIDIVTSVVPRDRELFLYNFLGTEGLAFSSAEINNISNIILGYIEAIEKLNNKDYFFKYFNNFKIISNFIRKKSKKTYKKYNFFYNYLINNKIAIQIKDLAIKGSDIKNSFPKIPSKRYAYILNELLSKVFDGIIKNNKKALLDEVANYDY